MVSTCTQVSGRGADNQGKIIGQVNLICHRHSSICTVDKLNIAKIRKGSNSVNTGDRVMILAFCDVPHGSLSVYQVSFNSLVYFETYAPDKLLIAKIKKGSNSINTFDRAMIFSFCTSSDDLYQCSQTGIEPRTPDL